MAPPSSPASVPSRPSSGTGKRTKAAPSLRALSPVQAQWVVPELPAPPRARRPGRRGQSPDSFTSKAIELEVALHEALPGVQEALFQADLASTCGGSLAVQLKTHSQAFDRVIEADYRFREVLQPIKAFYDRVCTENIEARVKTLQDALWAVNSQLEAQKQHIHTLEAKLTSQALHVTTLERQLHDAENQLIRFVDANKLSIVESSIHSIRQMNARLAKQADALAETLAEDFEEAPGQPVVDVALTAPAPSVVVVQRSLAQCRRATKRLSAHVEELTTKLTGFARAPRLQRTRAAVHAVIGIRGLQQTIESIAQGLDTDSEDEDELEEADEESTPAAEPSASSPEPITVTPAPINTVEASTQTDKVKEDAKQSSPRRIPLMGFTPALQRHHLHTRLQRRIDSRLSLLSGLGRSELGKSFDASRQGSALDFYSSADGKLLAGRPPSDLDLLSELLAAHPKARH